MAKLRFDANVPQEIALKFVEGKRCPSTLKDKDGNPLPDQMFYTLCGDDTMYVSLFVAEQIAALGIRKMELFSICKTVRNQVIKWEIKRIGDTATSAIPPNNFEALPTSIDATPIERQLTTSINQVNALKAQQRQALTPSKDIAPTAVVATVPVPRKEPTQTPSNSNLPIHHTSYSRMMAAANIAAIDAAREAERYAATVGFEIEYTTEDIRCMAATLFIAASKDPGFLNQPTQKVNGSTTWPA